MTKKYIVFDISNMLYKTFFSNKGVDDETSAGLAHHAALVTLNKYYKLFKPHKVVMAFDRSSWRKVYTADEELCLSGKPYKGNRRQKMTKSEKEKFERFLEHINEFEEIIRERTAIVCLACDGLEADDLVAGFVQAHPDDEIIIVSADKDLIQLLRSPNVSLIDPSSGKDRRGLLNEKWDGDVDYFLFEKCLRGDLGDNVQSAYPRVRSKKILEAYNDPFAKANMMHETWIDARGVEQVVKHMYNENVLLMDLSAQPECIRRKMFETIEEEMTDPGTFNYFYFMKFLGKYDMKKISANLDQFAPMLSR